MLPGLQEGPLLQAPVPGLRAILGNNVEEEVRRLDSNAGGFISENLRGAHTERACLSDRLETYTKLGGEREGLCAQASDSFFFADRVGLLWSGCVSGVNMGCRAQLCSRCFAHTVGWDQSQVGINRKSLHHSARAVNSY